MGRFGEEAEAVREVVGGIHDLTTILGVFATWVLSAGLNSTVVASAGLALAGFLDLLQAVVLSDVFAIAEGRWIFFCILVVHGVCWWATQVILTVFLTAAIQKDERGT